MPIVSAQLTNFRCFKKYQINFETPLSLIIGANGTGKTSLLEALHYLCYLKSFKTHVPKDLINLNTYSDQDNKLTGFAIKLLFSDNNSSISVDNLQAVFKNNKRSVSYNKKAITSYKELFENYKVITLTEDDLNLIKSAPQYRRSFIDQFIILVEPNYASAIKHFKQVLLNRNALISRNSQDYDSYKLWSQKLLDLTKFIQLKRIEYINYIQENINNIINNILKIDLKVTIDYKKAKSKLFNDQEDFEQILNSDKNLQYLEFKLKRSLWGAHLDDFQITFQDRNSKSFASRGQQKLVVFLIKAAQLEYIKAMNNSKNGGIFLIDDFITDLDEQKIECLLKLSTQIASQTIITCPINHPIVVNTTKSLLGQIHNL